MTSHRCGRCVCINHSPRDLCLLPRGRTEEIPLPPSWAWDVPGSFTKPHKHNCCESQGSSSPVLRDNQAGKAISAESVRVLDGYLLPGSRAEAGRGAFSPWGDLQYPHLFPGSTSTIFALKKCGAYRGESCRGGQHGEGTKDKVRG